MMASPRRRERTASVPLHRLQALAADRLLLAENSKGAALAQTYGNGLYGHVEVGWGWWDPAGHPPLLGRGA